ncbi:MAG: DNA polymerase III subunit delta [Pseudomonadota bacterium]|uniref:DNA polymerase III subunit delta n=1 Tax=Gallaecimonas pentaromativorans TaxID=584787 RepID=UPI00067E998C|nr:DNA polymerase III subunit delta [Gallaecimonas pentaromativorans]MED5525187.1 DNA polymerase III subunit delta [Pseudomonadota bacterium]
MQVRPQQLNDALKRQPLWVLVFGDDAFLVEEALDKIRRHGQRWGVEERLSFTVEGGFDWAVIREEYQSLSLFASKRIIEINLQQKPDESGKAVLQELTQHPNPDLLLVLRGPRAEKGITNAPWFKTMSEQGIYLPLYPLGEREFPGWLARKLQDAGFKPTPDAVQALAHFTEGNLLAAAQEVEKLALLHPQGPLSEDDITGAVLDHARFDLFQWTDALLGDDAAKALRVLTRVMEEGTEPPLLLWALGRELDTLLALVTSGNPQGELAKRRMPPQRKSLYLAAIKRLSAGRLRQIGRHLAWLDQQFKTQDGRGVEQGLNDLTLAFFPGKRPALPVIRPGYVQ